ncbi:MAG: hypothetical protein ACR2NL_10070 [Acidimicrobiia bacterium]
MNFTGPTEAEADLLLQKHDIAALDRLESQLIDESAPTVDQLAVKLAKSKARVKNWNDPLRISVVFAVYKESRRILNPEQDPIGEDFLNLKVSQLRWLFEEDDRWDLTVVDDGCPDGSGEIAQRIIAGNGYDRARVLYLAEAIADGHPVVTGLRTTDDSRKGGSIELGMYEAASGPAEGHIVAYTDADISTHLGQLGLLAGPIVGGSIVAAGSRREPTSVVVKSTARSDRGKLFIYLWKQLLPELRDIIDTQCGFKGFRREVVRELVTDTLEKKFAFDIELLLRAHLREPNSIERVAVAWIDSEAGSTTKDLEPYLPMLKSIAAMYRRYSIHTERQESFARLIEDMDDKSWEASLRGIPSAIVEREPHSFATWHGVEASEIRDAASQDDV